MNDDNDRTVVRSNHLHRPHIPAAGAGQSAGMNALPIGTRLGEFEITGLIGEGGFGIVYLAYDHSLDRKIALKEYMPSGMASRTETMQVTIRSRHYAETFTMGLKSFVNEARLLARFDSPSLVKVYRFWEENGTAYMVMPYYDGITLKQALKDRNIVPNEEWLRTMLAHLLDAVDTIHRVQCYHRDIAPDNILILKDGRPLLLDFGAARRVIGDLTQGLTVILKPGFAPIEQYADIPGTRQGPWTDIYALAAVVYFAIAGKSPPPSVARVVNDEMVPAREAGRGRYSEHFLAVFDRALAVKPEQRIQSVAELRDALGLDEDAQRTAPEPGSGTADDGHGLPRTGEPRKTRPQFAPTHDGDDDPHAMMEDQHSAPESKTKKIGAALAALTLCTVLGAAVISYRWMYPVETVETPLADSSVESPIDAASSTSGDAGTSASGGGTPSMAAPPPVAFNESKPLTEEKPVQDDTSKAIPTPPAATPPPVEDESWRAATTKDTPAAYEAYLKKYPKGKHAAIAKLMLDSRHTKITAAEDKPAPAQTQPEAQLTPASKAPAVEPEPKAATPSGSSTPLPPEASVPQPVLKTPTPEPIDIDPPKKEALKAEPPAAATSYPMPSPSQRTIKLPGQTMSGNFTSDPVTGIVSGTGLIQWDNGDRFEGRLVKGVKEGKGLFIWANGQRYRGHWADDMPNGRGVLQFANGDRYEGEVRNGEQHGQGTIRFRSGDVYTGGWVKGKQHGNGKYTWPNGTYWEGEFKDGKKTENGKTVFADRRTDDGSSATVGGAPLPNEDGNSQQMTGAPGK
jgi:serine/threonine protein kinase